MHILKMAANAVLLVLEVHVLLRNSLLINKHDQDNYCDEFNLDDTMKVTTLECVQQRNCY